MPFEDFHANIVTKQSLTRDLPILNENVNQFVFVYGTLKEGGSRSEALNPRDKVANARTLTPMWLMRTYKPGMFPVVTRPLASDDEAGYIKGELYDVKTSTVTLLDRIESNGYLYVRKPVRLWSYDTNEAVTAWMYETLPSAFNQKFINDENVTKVDLNGYPCYNWSI